MLAPPQRTKRGRPSLRDGAGFLETEISLPAVNWLTDDDVIQHLDLKNAGCFAESTGKSKISLAWAWVTGWVVVLCGPASYVQYAGKMAMDEAFYLGRLNASAAHN